jgi:hypothetical protein
VRDKVSVHLITFQRGPDAPISIKFPINVGVAL